MKKKKLNILIMMNCILSCVFLLLSGTFAAYTSLSNAKRTVSTVGSKQLFSSNILVPYDTEGDIQGKAMPFSSDVDENSFVVSICNFKQGDKTKWAAAEINYSVKVSLIDATGNLVENQEILSKYRWEGSTLDELEQPISGVLGNGSANENLYHITVPRAYMKDYRIKITADSHMKGYKSIGRIVSVAEEVTASQWKIHYLQDEQQQNAYDLGCINTKLVGSEHAELTLSWNPAYVQIDPWFLADMGIDAEKVEGSVTFEAGGENKPNQFNVTFYRTRAVHSDDSRLESWDDIKSYIILTSDPITE